MALQQRLELVGIYAAVAVLVGGHQLRLDRPNRALAEELDLVLAVGVGDLRFRAWLRCALALGRVCSDSHLRPGRVFRGVVPSSFAARRSGSIKIATPATQDDSPRRLGRGERP